MSTSSASMARALDSHLVLNSLGRVAAQFYAATQKESDELYALSDYLSLGMRLLGSVPTSLANEARLLALYAELLRSIKYSGLQLALEAPDDCARQMAAHSSCHALALLLQTARPEARQTLRVAARFSEQGARLELADVNLDGDPQERLARLQKELALQCPGWRMGACDARTLALEWTA